MLATSYVDPKSWDRVWYEVRCKCGHAAQRNEQAFLARKNAKKELFIGNWCSQCTKKFLGLRKV